MSILSKESINERRSEIGGMIETAAMRYVEFTDTTASYPSVIDAETINCGATPGLVYAALGIANEVGELAEHVAPFLDENKSPPRNALYRAVWGELGDCQWYVARVVVEAPITSTFPGIVNRAAALYYGVDDEYRRMLTANQLSEYLSAHAGRITGVVKKMIRDGKSWDAVKRHAKLSELEEHLVFFVARSFQFAQRTAPVVGIEGGYIGLLRENIAKLEGRKERGTLHGDGENR